MVSFLQSCLVLLAQGDAGAAKGAGGGNGGGGGAAPTTGLLELMPAMLGIFALYYFLFLRPQNKKRREKEESLKQVKKNDKVITIGGIHGVVVGVQGDGQEVVIRVDENNGTKIKMSRQAIHEIIRDKDEKSGTADAAK